MGMSPSRAETIADQQFGGGSPSTWYVGLAITEPSDDGANFVEPSGGSYQRVAVLNNGTNWEAASTESGVTRKRNDTKITFPNPTGTWGAIRAYGIFTSSTGGSPEYFNLLDSPITVQNGNTPVEFDVRQLVMTWGA